MASLSVSTRRRYAITDFPFPPAATGAWRGLSCAQREEWLVAACNRQFKRMKRRAGGRRLLRGEWGDAPAGTVFRLDAAGVTDLPAFFCALGEAVNGPGGYLGLSLHALQDCLFGAFGVALPFTLQIANLDVCRRHLDGRALAAWARENLDSRLAELGGNGDDEEDEGQQWLVAAERDGLAGTSTLLDVLLDLLREASVRIEPDPPPTA